jgi:hypothetical protein
MSVWMMVSSMAQDDTRKGQACFVWRIFHKWASRVRIAFSLSGTAHKLAVFHCGDSWDSAAYPGATLVAALGTDFRSIYNQHRTMGVKAGLPGP